MFLLLAKKNHDSDESFLFGIQKEVRLVLHSVKALALLEARSDF